MWSGVVDRLLVVEDQLVKKDEPVAILVSVRAHEGRAHVTKRAPDGCRNAHVILGWSELEDQEEQAKIDETVRYVEDILNRYRMYMRLVPRDPDQSAPSDTLAAAAADSAAFAAIEDDE